MMEVHRRKIFGIFVVLLFMIVLSSCAKVLRPDLKESDQLKLELDSLTSWYTDMYFQVSQDLKNPLLPEERKTYLKKEVTPLLNFFKKDLLSALDLYQEGRYTEVEIKVNNLRALQAKIIQLYGATE